MLKAVRHSRSASGLLLLYTGRQMGNADNYDLCINRFSIQESEGSVDFHFKNVKSAKEQKYNSLIIEVGSGERISLT